MTCGLYCVLFINGHVEVVWCHRVEMGSTTTPGSYIWLWSTLLVIVKVFENVILVKTCDFLVFTCFLSLPSPAWPCKCRVAQRTRGAVVVPLPPHRGRWRTDQSVHFSGKQETIMSITVNLICIQAHCKTTLFFKACFSFFFPALVTLTTCEECDVRVIQHV